MGTKHWAPKGIGTIEQDRQNKAVIHAAEVEERVPFLLSQAHPGQEPHAPGLRQHQTVVRSLKDWSVFFMRDRELLADRVEAQGDRLDRDECLARGRGNTSAIARRSTNQSSGGSEHGPMMIAVR
jgi:hypothetical protein